MTKNNSVVAIFKSHIEAETAVKELQRAGFDMKKLSIIGRDYHTDEHVVGYYNAGDRMKYWGKLGASGAASGACCSAPPSFLFPGSGRCFSRDPLSVISSALWKARWWWAV